MRELAEPTPQELRTAQTGAASKSRQQVESFGIESRLCDASRHPRVIRYTVAYDNAAIAVTDRRTSITFAMDGSSTKRGAEPFIEAAFIASAAWDAGGSR